MLEQAITTLRDTYHGWPLLIAVVLCGLVYAAALAFLTAPLGNVRIVSAPKQRDTDTHLALDDDPTAIETQFCSFISSPAERRR